MRTKTIRISTKAKTTSLKNTIIAHSHYTSP